MPYFDPKSISLLAALFLGFSLIRFYIRLLLVARDRVQERITRIQRGLPIGVRDLVRALQSYRTLHGQTFFPVCVLVFGMGVFYQLAAATPLRHYALLCLILSLVLALCVIVAHWVTSRLIHRLSDFKS